MRPLDGSLYGCELLAENALAFQHHVTVGHAGKLIADGAVGADFLETFSGTVADLFRVLEIILE